MKTNKLQALCFK